MRRVLAVLLVAICLAVAGCTALDKPPSPRVTAAGVTIPAQLGTYGWSRPGHGIQSDAPVPDEFVAMNAAPSVPAGSSVSIDYGCQPDDLFAYEWTDHEPTRVEIRSGTLQLPQESGVYVYSLESTWQEGHASHVIKIAVESK